MQEKSNGEPAKLAGNETEIIKCDYKNNQTGETCGAELYQTDGHHLMLGSYAINPEKERQIIVCEKCGGRHQWQRKSSDLNFN